MKYLAYYLSTQDFPLYKSDSSNPVPVIQCNSLNPIFCSLKQSIFVKYSLLMCHCMKIPLLKNCVLQVVHT